MRTIREIREEISRLSVDEKIQLVMDIWDDIADEDKPGLTDEQKEIIDQRMKEMESGNSKTYTWEEVKSHIEERIKAKKDK